MVEKFETESLPRENVRFSIPIEDAMQNVVAPVKKIKGIPPAKEKTVFVGLMDHEDMNAGWRFAEPSWGVKVDGQVKGIFPGDKGKLEAESHAKTLATKLNRKVFVVES